MIGRGTLFEKELRQNAGMMVSLFFVLLVVLFLLRMTPFSTGWGIDVHGLTVCYWITFTLATALGSVFLADENGSGTVNFLLRLPVKKKKIFVTKVQSHLAAVVLWWLAASWLIGFFGHLDVFSNWRGPASDYYTMIVWIPLIYFLAVSFSVVLGKSIAAFLAAAASATFIHAATLYLGVLLSQWIRKEDLPNLLLAHRITNIFLTGLFVGAACISWWLFSRKEGR